MEGDTGFLMIYDGGSEQAEEIGKVHGTMNNTKISTPRNQMFLVLHTNIAIIRLNTTVITSKYNRYLDSASLVLVLFKQIPKCPKYPIGAPF